MDNQHRKIKGYRELSQDEINTMNAIKAKGEELRELIKQVNSLDADVKWSSIAEEHLQQGIMCLVRSIAKPDSF